MAEHLLRIQRNGLKIVGNKIHELESSTGHNVKPFGRAQCEVSKGQSQRPNPYHLFLQNNPSNLIAKILSIILIYIFYGKKLRASQPYFGFPFMHDPNFLQEFVALVGKNCHVDILESNDLWSLASSVKGREVGLLVEIDNLSTFNHTSVPLTIQAIIAYKRTSHHPT